jgi:hypothetical protein
MAYSLESPVASVPQCHSPGVKLTHLQAAVLNRQKFVDALGSETVDSWQFDWLILENPDIPFDHSFKSSMMRQLHTKLHSLCPFHDSNATFQHLLSEFLKLRSRISFIHLDRLKNVAAQYFEQRFPCQRVFFRDKVGGAQLGAQIHFQLDTGQELKYHIKTHASGRIMSNSSAPKPVEPRELVVYKCLEYLGLGCEAAFLHRSLEDVFIATLDAGTGIGASFVLFQKVANELDVDRISGETVWGSLQSSLNHGLPRASIEAAIEHDAISQEFLLQISTLDLVSRIFRLQDLLNNAENFGFRISNADKPCLRVLDFRVDKESNFRLDRDKFEGFLAGNGLYNYESCHATLRYVLCDRLTSERVKTAFHAISVGPLSKGHRCIEDARWNVRSFLETSDFDVDELQLKSILKKCDEYCEALHQNLDFFASQLASWSEDS